MTKEVELQPLRARRAFWLLLKQGYTDQLLHQLYRLRLADTPEDLQSVLTVLIQDLKTAQRLGLGRPLDLQLALKHLQFQQAYNTCADLEELWIPLVSLDLGLDQLEGPPS
jgi:hypothetical protein